MSFRESTKTVTSFITRYFATPLIGSNSKSHTRTPSDKDTTPGSTGLLGNSFRLYLTMVNTTGDRSAGLKPAWPTNRYCRRSGVAGVPGGRDLLARMVAECFD